MPWVRPIPVGSCDAMYVLQRTGATKPDTITMSHDPTGALDQALANALFNSFATHMIAQLASAYTFQSVHILCQQDSSNQTAFDSTSPPIVGTLAASTISTLAAPQNALLVRKRTAFAGKHMRGRFYWPGVVESAVDGQGVIDGSRVTGMQTGLAAWFGHLQSFAPPMLSHSCFHEEGQPPCTPPPWTSITSFLCDDVIATQRRRLRRNG